MQTNSKYTIISIRNYLSNDSELGEDELKQILSEFSCPINLDVDNFLKENAIEFTKKNQSVAYLVFTMEDTLLVGYFTIAVKPLMVRCETINEGMSTRAKNKIKRVSELDETTQSYNMAAYLIAQLGKNYSGDADRKIKGSDLLELAWTVIDQIRQLGGGMVVFLEANDDPNLLNFYTDNGFQKFNIRQSNSKKQKPRELVQLLRLL